MEAIIRPTAEQAMGLVAQPIAVTVPTKPDVMLGLATGRSREQVYHRLAATPCRKSLDVPRSRTLNSDA